jgi:hypothetical protein
LSPCELDGLTTFEGGLDDVRSEKGEGEDATEVAEVAIAIPR